MKIITNKKLLSVKCLSLPYKESKVIANKMILFLLSHKNIADNTVGLACNQLGLDGRVIIIRNKNRWDRYINPIITRRSDKKITQNEECLSLPNKNFQIERNFSIRMVSSQKGFKDFEGFQARIIQHEIDHLDGILITDK
jgi:peptide deformylase